MLGVSYYFALTPFSDCSVPNIGITMCTQYACFSANSPSLHSKRQFLVTLLPKYRGTDGYSATQLKTKKRGTTHQTMIIRLFNEWEQMGKEVEKVQKWGIFKNDLDKKNKNI